METKRETLSNGTTVYTAGQHRIGTDALLLTRFCNPRPAWAAADLCAGCGVVLLGLWDAGLRGEMLAVDIAPGATALIEKAARHSKIPQLQVHTGDLRQLRPPRLYDLVTANPPYFDAGPPPPEPARALARHQAACGIADVCAAAGRLLKDRGRFCLCYPPARLAGLFAALAAARLAPKRMQLVRKTPEAPPWLVLLDARKNGGEGLSLLPDLLLPPGQTTQF